MWFREVILPLIGILLIAIILTVFYT